MLRIRPIRTCSVSSARFSFGEEPQNLDMDDPTGYETLYELLKTLKRTSLETTDPEILAIDCWEAFRTAVHEAVSEGRKRRCDDDA